MIVPQDDNKPRIVHKTLSSFAKYECMKAVNDDLKSMRTNHVWYLVDLLLGLKTIRNK